MLTVLTQSIQSIRWKGAKEQVHEPVNPNLAGGTMRRPSTPARFRKPVGRCVWDWADESGTLIDNERAITLL
jgi:hypothetical protein